MKDLGGKLGQLVLGEYLRLSYQLDLEVVAHLPRAICLEANTGVEELGGAVGLDAVDELLLTFHEDLLLHLLLHRDLLVNVVLHLQLRVMPRDVVVEIYLAKELEHRSDSIPQLQLLLSVHDTEVLHLFASRRAVPHLEERTGLAAEHCILRCEVKGVDAVFEVAARPDVVELGQQFLQLIEGRVDSLLAPFDDVTRDDRLDVGRAHLVLDQVVLVAEGDLPGGVDWLLSLACCSIQVLNRVLEAKLPLRLWLFLLGLLCSLLLRRRGPLHLWFILCSLA